MRSDACIVQLHATGTEVDGWRIYFTFASGRLGYDCVSCGAKCCRGHGYLASASNELALQLRMRRALPLFVAPPSEDNPDESSVRNCAPGCFFLSEEGLCEIHTEHGAGAKPETCRLFPFNNLRRVGRFLVVAPHMSLCPVGVVAGEAAGKASEHASLLGVMSARGVMSAVRECSSGAHDPEDVIALERRVVALSERSLDCGDYPAFVVEQMRLHASARGTTTIEEAAVAELVQLAIAFMDIPDACALGADPGLVRTMIAVTASLRARFLFHEVTSNTRDAPQQLSPERVPLAMLCIYMLAESARIAGMKRVTFQTISKLERDFRPVVELLAHADAVMTWHPGARIEIADIDDDRLRIRFVQVAKALLPASQARLGVRLGDLLRQHAPSDPLERATFLKLAARRLMGRIVPAEQAQRHQQVATRRNRLGGTFQRLMLTHGSEEFLRAMYRHAAARKVAGG